MFSTGLCFPLSQACFAVQSCFLNHWHAINIAQNLLDTPGPAINSTIGSARAIAAAHIPQTTLLYTVCFQPILCPLHKTPSSFMCRIVVLKSQLSKFQDPFHTEVLKHLRCLSKSPSWYGTAESLTLNTSCIFNPTTLFSFLLLKYSVSVKDYRIENGFY